MLFKNDLPFIIMIIIMLKTITIVSRREFTHPPSWLWTESTRLQTTLQSKALTAFGRVARLPTEMMMFLTNHIVALERGRKEETIMQIQNYV